MIFVTSNIHKFNEVKHIIPSMKMHKMDFIEPQDNIEIVAMSKAIQAYSKLKQPLVVEDTGLFLNALSGFPGEYSVWLHKRIGCRGIIDLLKDRSDRSGEMVTVVAYIDRDGIRLFRGILKVMIADSERGEGFGFDPILIPEGKDFTLAENPEYKLENSHRALAFKQLRDYLHKHKKIDQR
ncbi:MAG: non-canonical purine NTP pyrophosphatase [Candidatus Micrarchaeota archaeon]|nr:non-canonical purine NTP pyrophosphatase [Candidatus Micrarchaeota archaeon]MCX8154502.1 non-canonical purine NTP pyrophosphatase [Candidatus Micrarchaeota archaeon]